MRTVIRVNPIVCIYALVLLPYMGISALGSALPDAVLNGWMIVSAVFLTLRFLMLARRIALEKFSVLFIFFEIVVFLSTVVRHGFSPGILTRMYAMGMLTILVQADWHYMVRAILGVSIPVALINLAGMLFLQNPNEEYFIGGKNRLSMYFFPVVFLRMLHSVNRYGKIRKSDYGFGVLCIVMVVLGRSSTGIMTAAATAVALLAVERWKLRLDKKTLLTAYVVVSLLLILSADFLFGSQFWVDLTTSLGKETSLTGRTEVWNVAMQMVKEHFFFGTGRGTEISFYNSYGMIRKVWEAHNFILEIFLQGGLAAFVFFAFSFVHAVKGLNTDDLQHRIVFLMVMVLLANGLTESVNNFLLTIFAVALANYFSNFDKRSIQYG